MAARLLLAATSLSHWAEAQANTFSANINKYTWAMAAGNGTAQPSPGRTPCADSYHHEFDFWLGQWDVFGPKGKRIAQSHIESAYGCGIRENWMPLDGQNGGSLSIYVPSEKRWEQFYIDSSGMRALLQGGWTGKAMVLYRVQDPSTKEEPLSRMTYTVDADGSVRQYGEKSTNKGKTWSLTFDLRYQRRKDPE